MEVWKEFEHNEITHSAAHHLMAISDLLTKNGYARVTDVAKKLSITRGSASITLKALRERGLVEEDDNKFLHLSSEGKKLTHLVLSKRRILIKFFHEILKVSEDVSEIDACKIEHLISVETGTKLLSFVNYLLSDNEGMQNLENSIGPGKHYCADDEVCNICVDECFLRDKP